MFYQKLDSLQKRLKLAWTEFKSKASQQDIDMLTKLLQKHKEALFTDPDLKNISEFSLAASLLEDTLDKDLEKLLKRLSEETGTQLECPEDLKIVLANGDILGTGKYELLDIRWAEALIVYLKYFFCKRQFPQPGGWLHISDSAKIAVFGDWGGGAWSGNNVAQKISDTIQNSLKPDYCIHLGDVYYAGQTEEEQQFLLDLWPTGKLGNFTLNSNHEMYPDGEAYFETALVDPRFELQQGKSFFALENSNWIIVGLDSAFHAAKSEMYMQGAIGDEQINFLQEVAKQQKSVILLSHHNPVDLTGTKKNQLWDQVTGVLGPQLKVWYWGHLHAGAVYEDIDGVKCRVAGHGVIPWGNSTSLESHTNDNSQNPSVCWYENNPPSLEDGPRVQNGFAVLQLEKGTLQEAFYGEDGQQHWSNVWG